MIFDLDDEYDENDPGNVLRKLCQEVYWEQIKFPESMSDVLYTANETGLIERLLEEDLAIIAVLIEVAKRVDKEGLLSKIRM